MKNILTIITLAGVFCTSYAQKELKKETFFNDNNQKIEVVQAQSFKVSEPLSELLAKEDRYIPEEHTIKVKNEFKYNPVINFDALPKGPDPVWQKEEGKTAMVEPLVNFNGLNGGTPPDPSGAAGPNHYIQAVNTEYVVYDKTGTVLAGPFNLSSLWPGTNNMGDPIVMYDKHADRWFISQFQLTWFGSNFTGMLIAVSQTSDPLGSYYLYEYVFSDFPDYPKFSIWSDGYYMTSNSSRTACVFERDKILAGDASASYQLLTASSAATTGFRSVLPSDADGDLPPNGTPCYFFNMEDDAWGGVSTDRLKVYEMNTDWVTPSNTSISVSKTIDTEPFDADLGPNFQNITQKGTNQKLDGIPGVLMYRAQFTNWVDHNTIMLSHVVDVDGDDKAGVRWYELRDQKDGDWEIYQQGTYAPQGTASRFMSSIAMNSLGDIGLAYSFCGPDDYAGIRYTGRLAGDPLGEMTRLEAVAVEGGSRQTNTNRFGDYSHLSLDPDGETFWYTGEYRGTGGIRTRIFAFDVALENENVSVLNKFHKDLTSIVFIEDENLYVSAEGLYSNNEISLEIYSIKGELISFHKIQPMNESFQKSISVSSLSSGTYIVRFGTAEFQKTNKIFIK